MWIASLYGYPLQFNHSLVIMMMDLRRRCRTIFLYIFTHFCACSLWFDWKSIRFAKLQSNENKVHLNIIFLENDIHLMIIPFWSILMLSVKRLYTLASYCVLFDSMRSADMVLLYMAIRTEELICNCPPGIMIIWKLILKRYTDLCLYLSISTLYESVHYLLQSRSEPPQ